MGKGKIGALTPVVGAKCLQCCNSAATKALQLQLSKPLKKTIQKQPRHYWFSRYCWFPEGFPLYVIKYENTSCLGINMQAWPYYLNKYRLLKSSLYQEE